MLQIVKKFLIKKHNEVVYEKCQIVFILLQLNSCSFNLVNPGKNPGFIRFLPGPGLGNNGRGLPGPRSVYIADYYCMIFKIQWSCDLVAVYDIVLVYIY